jgi:hypothetical protein
LRPRSVLGKPPGEGNWEINVANCAERHPAEDLDNSPVLDEAQEAGAT